MSNTFKKLVKILKAKGLVITTMESCTGGALTSAITDIPGASEIFQEGFVTYSNEAKIKQGVRADLIDRHGVYSWQVASNMAQALWERSDKDMVAVGVTGKLNRGDPANPDDKAKVGEVHMGIRYGNSLGLIAEGTFLIEVTPELSREAAKKFVVEEIGKNLLGVLTKD